MMIMITYHLMILINIKQYDLKQYDLILERFGLSDKEYKVVADQAANMKKALENGKESYSRGC